MNEGTPILNCTHGDIQLESGRNGREGTLRVCIGGVWSTVCSSGWDSQDAAVVCRQLGFPISGSLNSDQCNNCIIACCFNAAAIPLLTTRSGGGTGMALISNFACTGRELSLLSCRYTLITSSCHYTNFVGVQCLGKTNSTCLNC